MVNDFIKKLSVKPILQKYSSILNSKDKNKVDSSLPKRSHLVPKKMSDSYVEEFLPFKSNIELLEDYINPSGGIRYF